MHTISFSSHIGRSKGRLSVWLYKCTVHEYITELQSPGYTNVETSTRAAGALRSDPVMTICGGFSLFFLDFQNTRTRHPFCFHAAPTD